MEDKASDITHHFCSIAIIQDINTAAKTSLSENRERQLAVTYTKAGM